MVYRSAVHGGSGAHGAIALLGKEDPIMKTAPVLLLIVLVAVLLGWAGPIGAEKAVMTDTQLDEITAGFLPPLPPFPEIWVVGGVPPVPNTSPVPPVGPVPPVPNVPNVPPVPSMRRFHDSMFGLGLGGGLLPR